MPSASRPLAVEVENLRKFFRLPGAVPRGAINRLAHPRATRQTAHAAGADGVAFDVRRGELFSIAGRNGGCGRSTLLRVLGSICRADGGRGPDHGQLAPFIEPGVGFQPEMSA